MKNYEPSNDQKISTPYIFVILQGTVFTRSQTIFGTNIPVKNYRIPRYPFYDNITPF